LKTTTWHGEEMAEQQDLDETVRLAIYSGYAASGRALGEAELADRAGVTVREVREALLRLAAGRHLVLDASGAVIMAHPFASIPLGFAVMGSSTLWWGGCAWDSFAIPHLVPGEPEVLVSTRCPGCGRALAWVVGRDGPPTGDAVAHFLVPMAHVWDDVITTCGHQRLFCSADCVDRWLASTDNEMGSTMDLATLWRLARHWYDGRLDPGYVRREPSQARAYFREVGLSGPFWGLD
jgi:hypothetical protein